MLSAFLSHSRPWRENRVKLVAFLLRLGLDDADVAQVCNQPLENPTADLRVRVLAAAEEDRRLDLVALRQEALDVLLLELVVVFVNPRPEIDLFAGFGRFCGTRSFF